MDAGYLQINVIVEELQSDWSLVFTENFSEDHPNDLLKMAV